MCVNLERRTGSSNCMELARSNENERAAWIDEIEDLHLLIGIDLASAHAKAV